MYARIKNAEEVFNYTITVEGRLSRSWLNILHGFKISYSASGHTKISGMVVNPGVFYKVLSVLNDMGISIIKIRRKPYQHKKAYLKESINLSGGKYEENKTVKTAGTVNGNRRCFVGVQHI
ncbi:MAG: hypothetical protein JW822_05225 [Spirochaetales bacterium]|nr:hypothetical protein [Spirochaetales bacterium]